MRFSAIASIPAVIFGIVVFWENHHEAFQPGNATLYAKVPTLSGYGAQINLTNNGVPPVVIDRAHLDLGGKRYLNIRFYIKDPLAINEYAVDPSRVAALRQPLPVVVDPHSTETVVLLADPATANTGRAGQKQKRFTRLEQGTFCEFIPDKRWKKMPKDPMELTLHLDWSGLVLRNSVLPWFADGNPEVQVTIAGDKLTQPSWVAELSGPRPRPRPSSSATGWPRDRPAAWPR